MRAALGVVLELSGNGVCRGHTCDLSFPTAHQDIGATRHGHGALLLWDLDLEQGWAEMVWVLCSSGPSPSPSRSQQAVASWVPPVSPVESAFLSEHGHSPPWSIWGGLNISDNEPRAS